MAIFEPRQFLLEGGHRFVAPAWRHQQQPPRFQVVHHSNVVMSLLEAGFIDADHPYWIRLIYMPYSVPGDSDLKNYAVVVGAPLPAEYQNLRRGPSS